VLVKLEMKIELPAGRPFSAGGVDVSLDVVWNVGPLSADVFHAARRRLDLLHSTWLPVALHALDLGLTLTRIGLIHLSSAPHTAVATPAVHA
jgi:hypothetical protein